MNFKNVYFVPSCVFMASSTSDFNPGSRFYYRPQCLHATRGISQVHTCIVALSSLPLAGLNSEHSFSPLEAPFWPPQLPYCGSSQDPFSPDAPPWEGVIRLIRLHLGWTFIQVEKAFAGSPGGHLEDAKGDSRFNLC